MHQLKRPISLNNKYTVDLMLVGSTAVCATTGARVGKGEGFAELEWGILTQQGNLEPESTLVVTTVHDEQVVTDIPACSLTKHLTTRPPYFWVTGLISGQIPNLRFKFDPKIRCHVTHMLRSFVALSWWKSAEAVVH